MKKTASAEKREKIRQEFWSKEAHVWTGEKEKGWFRAPRTLALLLILLSSKEISGKSDPTRVYLELLSRHIDGGVIEIISEQDHAYAAGYAGTRGLRTWQERMHILEKTGFIKTKKIGNHRFKYVLLIHPACAIEQLRAAGKVTEDWMDTYKARKIETKEASYQDKQNEKDEQPGKVVPFKHTRTNRLSRAKDPVAGR